MKKYIIMAASMTWLVSAIHAEEKKTLKTTLEKQSYSMGVNIATRMKTQSINIEADAFMMGFKDALSGDKLLLLSEAEIKETLASLEKEIREKQAEKLKENAEKLKNTAEKSKKESLAFLEENKTKKGVVSLPSGLQYKILKEGTGKLPGIEDVVVCNYRGTLIDGTEFDSSYKAGKPATFPLKGVIRGWTEILQLMKEGSKWEVYIPSDLAYGEKGAAGIINPYATLIFEIELISIK